MTATWPTGLSQNALIVGYSEEPESNLVELQPDAGPPLRRRRTSVATDIISFQMVLSDADYETLMAFWRDDCKDGAIDFTRNHPRTGDAGVTFVWVQPPSMTPEGPWRRVSISLRKMP